MGERRCAMSRDTTSELPPGAKPTSSRIGREGQGSAVCAKADGAAQRPIAARLAPSTRRRGNGRKETFDMVCSFNNQGRLARRPRHALRRDSRPGRGAPARGPSARSVSLAPVECFGEPQPDFRQHVQQHNGYHLNAHERQHASEYLVQGHMRRRDTLQIERGHRHRR